MLEERRWISAEDIDHGRVVGKVQSGPNRSKGGGREIKEGSWWPGGMEGRRLGGMLKDRIGEESQPEQGEKGRVTKREARERHSATGTYRGNEEARRRKGWMDRIG